MPNPITGRCCCGAVRFHCDSRPVATRACWCRDCQYLASGNASVNAIFCSQGFAVTGELSSYVSAAASARPMRRQFCPRCGTPLFSEDLSEPGFIAVRAGALDDPAVGRPERFIWTASAPDWGLIDRRLPNCEGQPEPVRADRRAS